MNKLFKHLHIVHTHRKYVRHICFKMGIPLRGLLHDLSKYSLTELSIYKYYTGKGSPHEECRHQIGYSPSWIHHKHKNKHHYQFWLDDSEDGELIAIEMPYKYVIEMYCDMVGAGMAYLKSEWKTKSPWEYYITRCFCKRKMHPNSEGLLVYLFQKTKEYSNIKDFYRWYKHNREDLEIKYRYKYFTETYEKLKEHFEVN